MGAAVAIPALNFVSLVSASIFIAFSSASALSNPSLLGTHPLDEKYFAAEVIKCKDGSKSFTRDRINDNFCDCIDGTDEPGTSACPAGKFYCRNIGSTPLFLYSSRVNDHICDCCDGSDENDGGINCPNTCIMGGNLEYKSQHYSSKIKGLGSIDGNIQRNVKLEDLIERAKGLKLLIVLQAVLLTFVVAFRLLRRRGRSRRKLHR